MRPGGRSATRGWWGGTADLAPGERLTLTEGGPYCRPAESDVAWPLVEGTPVYAQVDSANAGTTHGAVLERHEMMDEPYNHVTGTEVAGRNCARERR